MKEKKVLKPKYSRQFRRGGYNEKLLLAIAMGGEFGYKNITLACDHYSDIKSARRLLIRALKGLKLEQEEGERVNSVRYEHEFKKHLRERRKNGEIIHHQDLTSPYVSVIGDSSKGTKRLHLLPRGEMVLREYYPEFWEFFLYQSSDNEYSAKVDSIKRKIHLSEVMQLVSQSHQGIKFLFSDKPELTKDGVADIGNNHLFYTSREVKQAFKESKLKIDFTRFYGVVVNKHNAYPIYNTEKSLFLWKRQGENKAQTLMAQLFFDKFGIENLASNSKISMNRALFMGDNFDTALQIINSRQDRKTKSPQLRGLDYEFLSLSTVFAQGVHFLPKNNPLLMQIAFSMTVNPKVMTQVNTFLFKNHPNYKQYHEEKMPALILGDCYNPEKEFVAVNCLDGNLLKLKRVRDMAFAQPNLHYQFFCSKEQEKLVDGLFKNVKNVEYEKIFVNEQLVLKYTSV